MVEVKISTNLNVICVKSVSSLRLWVKEDGGEVPMDGVSSGHKCFTVGAFLSAFG